MRALASKTSIFLAGFLNGINFFNFSCNHSDISKALGSLKATTELSEGNGLQKDAEKLSSDWIIVRSGLMSSFKTLENELPKKSA